jgi:hypothetical protein
MDELYHHGIKGQKWGVRRYQEPSGTWTEEGLRRRRTSYRKDAYDKYEWGLIKDYTPYNSHKDYKDAVKKYKREIEAEEQQRRKANPNMSPWERKSDFDMQHEAEEKAKHGNNEIGKNAEKTGKIPKNTEMYRVSYDQKEQLGKDRKYVTLNKYEAKQYADPYLSLTWIQSQLGNEYGEYETGTMVKYTAVKDLKVANSKQVLDFCNSLSDVPLKMPDPNSIDVQETRNIRNIRDVLFTQYKDLSTTNKNDVYEHFRKLGYDAMSDIEDYGVGSDSAALVVLNPKDSLKEVSKSKIKERSTKYKNYWNEDYVW